MTHVLRERRPVPERRAETVLLRALEKVRLERLPLPDAERAWPSRSLSLSQSPQPALFEAANPTLYGGVVLAEKPGHVTAGVPCRQQQQSMEPMVIA